MAREGLFVTNQSNARSSPVSPDPPIARLVRPPAVAA